MDVIERDIAPAAETARVDRAIACLRQAPSRLETFDGVVELDFEGVGAPWFVRGPSGEIGQRRPDGPVQASLTLSADNLVRLIDGQFDPRCGFMFGQIKVAGQVAIAMRFCDAAAGAKRRDAVFDAAILPKPTTDWARAKADLDTFGYCLVKDALTPAKTAALRQRLRDQADGETAAGVATFDGGPGGPNQRVWALVNKGQEFIDLLDDPIIDAFVPDLLGDHSIIFSYSANIAGPGGRPQMLHYDQISVQPPVPEVMIGLNIAFFLDDVTDANGGTAPYMPYVDAVVVEKKKVAEAKATKAAIEADAAAARRANKATAKCARDAAKCARSEVREVAMRSCRDLHARAWAQCVGASALALVLQPRT